MKRLIVLSLAFAAVFPASAADYAMPYVSMGYEITNDTSGVFLTYDSQLAFPGYTLEDALQHDFFGRLAGTNIKYTGENYEGGLRPDYYKESWTNEQGQLEKVLFSVNGHWRGTSGYYAKAVVVLLTNGVDGVYAVVPANGACNVLGGPEDAKFAEFNADGSIKYLQASGKDLATADDMKGYGCRGLTMTRYIPSNGQSVLAFKNTTVDEIKGHAFTGYACGRSIANSYTSIPMTGYNAKVTEESAGVATKLRVEMQAIDGIYCKCVVVEFTNGEGGVYVKALAARYLKNGAIGYKFAKDGGGYNGSSQTLARDFSMTGYGVFALKAIGPSDVVTAHWTGLGGDGNGMNPDNWACTNRAGQGVSGALPTNAEATVFLNAPLDRNLDWRGLGAFALAADSLVDLNGHEFAVGGFANRTDGVIITNANDGVTGDFVVDVAAGETVQNATMAILGNVRVVKNGAGDFVGAVTNQLYSGGTVVNAGTIRSVGYEKNLYYGDRDAAFVVNAGGALDINGQYDWCAHPIVLAGGTLRNGGAHQTQYTWNGLGDITLTADSKVALEYHMLFKSDGAGLDLGGHALTVERTDTTANVLCSFNGTYTVMNGNLISEKGIRLNLRQAGVIIKDVNLTVNGSWIHNASTFSVVDLTENLTSGEGAGVAAVSGVFRTNGKFDNVRLVDGATLDLRDKTGPFSVDSQLRGYALTFGEGATVTIDLTGRTIAEGDKIIAWSAMPPVTSRILGRGRSPSAPSAPLYFVRRADGLYAARTPLIFVR